MGKNFVENLVLILHILKTKIASVHDRDAYFIEHVFRKILFPVK